MNEELLKVEYIVNFSQYFINFANAIIRSRNKTFFRKVSKKLAEFDKLSFIFLDRKLNQNVYNGKFCNVNNEFNVATVRN